MNTPKVGNSVLRSCLDNSRLETPVPASPPQATRLGEMLQEQEESLQYLHKLISELQERLAPVSHEYPQQPEEVPNADFPFCLMKCKKNTEIARIAAGRLQDIMNNLAL